jgi:uncharacterized protein YggE
VYPEADMIRLAFAATLILVCSTRSNAQVQPQNQAEASVVVAQGEAVVRQAPDVAWVQVAVEARGLRPEEARERAATAMTSVLGALKQHVPATAIRTSGYSIVPEMEYVQGSSRLKGYIARNQLEVNVEDLLKLTSVMDASVTSGATSIASLRFDVKARPQIERDALRLAVQDGMARAQAIAAGASRTLGAIVRLQEQRVTGQGVRLTTFAGGGGGGRGGQTAETSTPVNPGEIEIRAVVTLTVSLR